MYVRTFQVRILNGLERLLLRLAGAVRLSSAIMDVQESASQEMVLARVAMS
jgi:hypothetical protein